MEKTKHFLKQLSAVFVFILIGIILVPFSDAQAFSYAPVATQRAHLPGADIEVTFLGQDPDPAQPGEIAELKWKVENYGSWEVNDIDVKLDLKYPFMLVSGETDTKSIGSLEAKQIGDKSYLLKWKVRIDETAAEGEYDLDLSYAVDGTYVRLEPAVISIKTRGVVLNIETIEIDPEKIEAGKEASLRIGIKNVGDTAVDDVKVKMDIDGTDFSAIGSANEKTIKKILGGEIRDVYFRLGVNGDAKSKVHRIPLKLEYKNRFNEQFSVDTSFGIIVDTPPSYVVNLDESTIYTAKHAGKIIISLSNIGKSDINFAAIELLPSKQYTVISSPIMYLGNLESDDYETAEYKLYVGRAKNEVPLNLKLTFKDNFNKEYAVNKAIPLKIYTTKDAVNYGLIQKQGGLGFIAFLLILGGAGYYLYKKKYLKRSLFTGKKS